MPLKITAIIRDVPSTTGSFAINVPELLSSTLDSVFLRERLPDEESAISHVVGEVRKITPLRNDEKAIGEVFRFIYSHFHKKIWLPKDYLAKYGAEAGEKMEILFTDVIIHRAKFSASVFRKDPPPTEETAPIFPQRIIDYVEG